MPLLTCIFHTLHAHCFHILIHLSTVLFVFFKSAQIVAFFLQQSDCGRTCRKMVKSICC